MNAVCNTLITPMVRYAILFLVLVCASISAPAHDSPEHVIELLTARMASAGERPELLWRRATEHRALGNLSAAGRDLRRALRLQSDYLPALTDLGRVRTAQGRHRAALAAIDRAFRFVRDEPGRAPLHMLRAEIYSDVGNIEQASRECDLALCNGSGGELDWYLTRSQIQCRLGRYADAVAGLRQGYELTGSAVLEVEGIDAMIEAGQYVEALQKIEPILQESRLQSAWLIRRARVRLASGEITAAQADLAAAIRELNGRLGTPTPESSLMAERGLAHALLGDEVLARRDLAAARKLGAEPLLLRRVEQALGTGRKEKDRG